MKIVINPAYTILESFVSNIPDRFDQEGELVYIARNQLKHFNVEGYDVIVKRYKEPHFINRVAYSYFRPSKAKRAYEYAFKLLELGIESPAPIGYIEQYKSGLLTYGYFVSVYEKNYSVIRDFMSGIQTDELLLKALSLYIANLHAKGVLHLDMSPGNILYLKDAEKYHFTLIDINRMQFLPSVSTIKRFKSFKRLAENESILTIISKLYAEAAHLNVTEAVTEINRYSNKFFSSGKRAKTRNNSNS